MLNDVRVKYETGETMDIIPTKWKAVRKLPVIVGAIQMPYSFEVETLEGLHSGKKGDYLLKGIKGELYPVKKEIFEETYEYVNNAGT